MKKTDWILAAAILIYSILFYHQAAGINFFIFNIILIGALLYRKPELKRSRVWLVAVACSISTTIAIILNGTALAVWANVFALGLLSAFSINPQSSVIAALFFAAYSSLSSIAYMFLDAIERQKNRVVEKLDSPAGKGLIYGIPLIVVLIFFFLYRESNPVFNKFTNAISLDFISFQWILFTLGGAVLIYGFFYHRQIQPLAGIDNNASNSLILTDDTTSIMGKRIERKEENQSGVILLGLLNLLIIVVNALDVKYLFGGTLPDGLSYSEFVHQGTGALISSIVIAIAIILFYFRGNLNFYKENKLLKLLAYAWIVQNIFMILSTAYRNHLYINEYSLTYKRIGVYVFLLLATIGLFTTIIKIAKIKSNYYLFRINSWLFYTVMIISSFIAWDTLICNFNINKAAETKKLDREYLLDLSNVSLPYLLKLKEEEIKVFPAGEYERYSYQSYNYRNRLHAKLFHFLEDHDRYDWRSFNLSDRKVYDGIESLRQQHYIDSLDISFGQITSIEPLKHFPELKKLTIDNNSFRYFFELNFLKKLEYLSMRNNTITQVMNLPIFPDLKELDLSNNRIRILGNISNQKALTRLNLGHNDLRYLNGIEDLAHLEELDISGNPELRSLSPLLQLMNLKKLTMDKRYSYFIPKIKRANPEIKIHLNNNQ